MKNAATLYYLPLAVPAFGQRADCAKASSKTAWRLVRALAANELGLRPGALAFARGEHGKPYLKDCPNFHFSLSHTAGAVLVGHSSQPCGVDIEHRRPLNRRMVYRYFTPAEQAWVLERGDLLTERFLHVWTRKEALAKRSGLGMAIGFGQLDVLSGPDAGLLQTRQIGPHTVSWSPGGPGDLLLQIDLDQLAEMEKNL